MYYIYILIINNLTQYTYRFSYRVFRVRVPLGIQFNFPGQTKYNVRIIPSANQTAWRLTWLDNLQKVKKWNVYLLFGFIPIRVNKQVIYNTGGQTPDWDFVNKGWQRTGKNARKNRRREHKSFREVTKKSKGKD